VRLPVSRKGGVAGDRTPLYLGVAVIESGEPSKKLEFGGFDARR